MEDSNAKLQDILERLAEEGYQEQLVDEGFR